VRAIRRAPIEPGMPVPPVLVVAPPPIRDPKGAVACKFEGAAERCHGVATAYRAISEELGCAFFDSGSVVVTSDADGVHLDAEQHRVLGIELGKTAEALLERSAAALA
jgi:hypothetical protein